MKKEVDVGRKRERGGVGVRECKKEIFFIIISFIFIIISLY